jgi:4-aminobutyrate aminotransferase-like enzyme
VEKVLRQKIYQPKNRLQNTTGLGDDKVGGTKKPATDERNKLVQKAFERGLVLLRAGTSSLRPAPPPVPTEEQADVGLGIFEQSLKDIKPSE